MSCDVDNTKTMKTSLHLFLSAVDVLKIEKKIEGNSVWIVLLYRILKHTRARKTNPGRSMHLQHSNVFYFVRRTDTDYHIWTIVNSGYRTNDLLLKKDSKQNLRCHRHNVLTNGVGGSRTSESDVYKMLTKCSKNCSCFSYSAQFCPKKRRHR